MKRLLKMLARYMREKRKPEGYGGMPNPKQKPAPNDEVPNGQEKK